MAPKIFAIFCAALLGAACSEEKNGPSKIFDPAYIAEQADKGNLAPLTEISAACADEVKSGGRRGDICAAKQKAGELRKPINIRF